MATIKKACKGVSYPKSSSVSKRLGSPSKAKSGGSFPDLNKDGKITKKDILIGKGVLPKTAKKGMKVKKAKDGYKGSKMANDWYKDQKSKPKSYIENPYAKMVKEKSKPDTIQLTPPAPRKGGKLIIPKPYKKGGSVKKTMKTGGKMTKKCAYGCK